MELIGQKIQLTPIQASMTDRLFEAFVQMDEECRIMTGTHYEVTREKVAAYASKVQQPYDEHHFAIEIIEEKRIIGELALTDIDARNKNCVFRFSIYKEEDRGRGYGKEAMQLSLQFAFEELDLHRIELTVYEKNNRAHHLYKKLGFVTEGVQREVFYYEDAYHDGIIMSMLEDEYS